MDKKVEYWLEMADYDMVTAKAMLESKRYLYVGFMCHQVIEKSLKGFFVQKKSEMPPYIHNLSRISIAGDFYDEFNEEQKDIIDMLEPLNIEARYPSYKEKLLSELNEKKCREILSKTEELYEWIKKKF